MAYIGFDKLAAKTSPAIAASIGRKKYGKKKFQKAAKEGKTMENEKPLQEGGTVKRNPALNPDSKVLAKKRRKLEAIKKKNIRENKKPKEGINWKELIKNAATGPYRVVSRALKNKRKGGIISKLQDGGIVDKRKVTKTKLSRTPFNRGKRKFKTKEVFKDGEYVQPYTGRFQRGGVAQGKSPGVDTPTTIDGTTYYQDGGKTTTKETKNEFVERDLAFQKQKKLYNKYTEKKTKDNLDTIQAALLKANVEREAIGTADDIKARKLKREQDKLKQEAKSQIFKKGGKMKYKKGGIVSKLQRGGEASEFGKRHDRLRKRAQNIESKNLQRKPTGKGNWKKEDRRDARAARLRDKARGIRSESYELQTGGAIAGAKAGTEAGRFSKGAIEGGIKGGIIGKIKKKLKKKKTKKDEFEEISPYYSEIEQDLEKQGKAPATTKKRYGYSSSESEIEEDLRRGNRL